MTWKLSRSSRGPWLVLVGPYRTAFVDDLVRTVPSSARQWLPVAKAWRISEEYEDAVRQLIADHTKAQIPVDSVKPED